MPVNAACVSCSPSNASAAGWPAEGAGGGARAMLGLKKQRGRAAQRAVCSTDCLQPTLSLCCRALWFMPFLYSCAWAPSSLLFFSLFLHSLSLFSQTQRWPEQTASRARTGWANDYHDIANMHISSIYTITHTLGSIQLSHATSVLQWLTRARRRDRDNPADNSAFDRPLDHA